MRQVRTFGRHIDTIINTDAYISEARDIEFQGNVKTMAFTKTLYYNLIGRRK